MSPDQAMIESPMNSPTCRQPNDVHRASEAGNGSTKWQLCHSCTESRNAAKEKPKTGGCPTTPCPSMMIRLLGASKRSPEGWGANEPPMFLAIPHA